jgi:hypothetical protein
LFTPSEAQLRFDPESLCVVHPKINFVLIRRPFI